MDEILKITKVLEDSGILLTEITKTIKNGTKEQNGGFLSMLLGILGATLLGNMLARKVIVRAGYENKQGEGIVTDGYEYNKKILIPPHPLTNFERRKYYQNEPYSRANLPKTIKMAHM